MSLKRIETINCPACGKQQDMFVWSTVNAIDPKAAQMVREQRVNMFQCTQCAHQAFVDSPVLYHDMENRYCVQYVSRDQMGDPDFYATLSKQGTLILDELSQRLFDSQGETYFNHPHFVFSTREMAAYIVFRELCAAHGQAAGSAT